MTDDEIILKINFVFFLLIPTLRSLISSYDGKHIHTPPPFSLLLRVFRFFFTFVLVSIFVWCGTTHM